MKRGVLLLVTAASLIALIAAYVAFSAWNTSRRTKAFQGVVRLSAPSTDSSYTQALPAEEVVLQLTLPDDLLFVYHDSNNAPSETLYLVSLDQDSKVKSVTPIDGFSAYFAVESQFIRSSPNLPSHPNRNITVRIADPAFGIDHQTVSDKTCRDNMSPRDLYLVAAHALKDHEFATAKDCYNRALAKSPTSLAALYGNALACPLRNRTCSDPILKDLIQKYPDFADARWMLTIADHDDSDTAGLRADDEERLRHPMSTRMRKDLLDVLIEENLNRGNAKEAVSLARNWRQAALQLYATDSKRRNNFAIEAEEYGQAEEGSGLPQDALQTYEYALYTLSKSDTNFFPSVRFRLEMAYARTLTKVGRAAEAKTVCNGWQNHWQDVVRWKQPHDKGHAQSDVQEEIEASWELACGSPDRAGDLLSKARELYPLSGSVFDASEQYFFARGEIEKALAAKDMVNRIYTDPSTIPAFKN